MSDSDSIRDRFHPVTEPHPPLLSGGEGPRGHSLPLIVIPSEASSPASADSTTDSPKRDGSTCSCASPTVGGGGCCESGSPVSPSTTTYETLTDERLMDVNALPGPLRVGTSIGIPTVPLIFSVEGSRARTCPSPDNDADSPASVPDSSTSSPGSPTLFDLAGYSSRTYPASSPRTAVGTSESCLERWPTSGTAWDGGFSTAVSSECRSDDEGCSSSEPSLTEILEPPQGVPARYSLSGRAAKGILRRAEKRGRTLPTHLMEALEAVSRT